MEHSLHNKIFSSSDCLNEELLWKYSRNLLSQKEKYRVEKHLVECEFCSDAMEGISSASLNELKEIQSEVRHIALKGFAQNQNRWKYFLVAASVIGIVFVSSYFFFQQNKEETILAENTKNIPEEKKEIITSDEKTKTVEIPQTALEVAEKGAVSEEKNTLTRKETDGKGNQANSGKDNKRAVVASREISPAKKVVSEPATSEQAYGGITISADDKNQNVAEMQQQIKSGETTVASTTETKPESVALAEDVLKDTDELKDAAKEGGGYAKSAELSASKKEDEENFESGKRKSLAGKKQKKQIPEKITVEESQPIAQTVAQEKSAVQEEENNLEKINRHIQQNPNDMNAVFSRGVVYYNSGNYDKAMEDFNLASSDKNLKDDCDWYKALSLKQKNETEKAKTVLRNISEKSKYRKQAADMLEKMEK